MLDRLRQATWTALFTLTLVGCAHTAPDVAQEPVEAVFALPADQVRAAAVEVFTQEGYDVDDRGEADTAISAGYRQETPSPWNWLLRARVGVGRTTAEARITALSDTSSKLSIQTQHQSKATLWNTWKDSDAPLAQQPGYYLRLIKQRLQVL